MSGLERETIEKLNHQNEPEFNFAAWVHDVEALRQEIRASREDNLPPVDVVGMLRNIRDGEDE